MLALEERAMIWDKIFELLDINFDQEEPITLESLLDPGTRISESLLKILSLNTFLPQSMNEASRFKE